jgi:hypothetical protein
VSTVASSSAPIDTPANRPNGVARPAIRATYLTRACSIRCPAADSGASRHVAIAACSAGDATTSASSTAGRSSTPARNRRAAAASALADQSASIVTGNSGDRSTNARPAWRSWRTVSSVTAVSVQHVWTDGGARE